MDPRHVLSLSPFRVLAALTSLVMVVPGGPAARSQPSLHTTPADVMCASSHFATHQDYSAAGRYPEAVTVGEFNADGRLDLAVADGGSDRVSILLGNGHGNFRVAFTYGVGSGPHSIAVGEFNDDDRPDLAVANTYSDNLSILLGNGDGSF
jgi:hypothetical protein